MFTDIFSLDAASVPGRTHRRSLKSNTDAIVIGEESAVICTGLDAAPYGEFGARLIGELLVNALESDRLIDRNQPLLIPADDPRLQPDPLFLHAFNLVIAHLRVLTDYLCRDGNRDGFVREHFQVSLVGMFIDLYEMRIFSIGPSTVFVNEKRSAIPSTHPTPMTSIADALLDIPTLPSNALCFNVVKLSSPDVKSFLLGSQGMEEVIQHERSQIPGTKEVVGPIRQFWTPNKSRPTQNLKQRLVTITQETPTLPGLIEHDTSILVGHQTRRLMEAIRSEVYQ